MIGTGFVVSVVRCGGGSFDGWLCSDTMVGTKTFAKRAPNKVSGQATAFRERKTTSGTGNFADV